MSDRTDNPSGLGIVGYDAYEFVVADLERSRRFYTQMMDVSETARLTDDAAAERGENGICFTAGKAQCVCVAPRERGSAADRWLKRHPDVENRPSRIRAVSGQWTTADGLKTEVVTVTIVVGDDIAEYDPEEDADLYEYWKAEARYWEVG